MATRQKTISKVSTVTTSTFHSSSSIIQVTPKSASRTGRLTLDSFGESPHWISGDEALFRTPKSLSPLKTRRKTTVVHTEVQFTEKGTPSKKSYQKEIRAEDFKVPSLMFSSPPGVKTRSRRSSVYVSGKQQATDSSRRQSFKPPAVKMQKQAVAVKRVGKQSNAKKGTTKLTVEKVLMSNLDEYDDAEVSFNLKNVTLSPNKKATAGGSKSAAGRGKSAKGKSITELVQSASSKVSVKSQKGSPSPKSKKLGSRRVKSPAKLGGKNTSVSSRSSKRISNEVIETVLDQEDLDGGPDESFTSIKSKVTSRGQKEKNRASKSPRRKSPQKTSKSPGRKSPQKASSKTRRASPSPRRVGSRSRKQAGKSESVEEVTQVSTDIVDSQSQSTSTEKVVSSSKRRKSSSTTRRRASGKSPEKEVSVEIQAQGSSSSIKARRTKGKTAADVTAQADDNLLSTPSRRTPKKRVSSPQAKVKRSSSKSRKSKGSGVERISSSIISVDSEETQSSQQTSKRRRSRSKTPQAKSPKKSVAKQGSASAEKSPPKRRKLQSKGPQVESSKETISAEAIQVSPASPSRKSRSKSKKSKSPKKSKVGEVASPKRRKSVGKTPIKTPSAETPSSVKKALPRASAEKPVSPPKSNKKSASKSKGIRKTPSKRTSVVEVSSSQKSSASSRRKSSRSPRSTRKQLGVLDTTGSDSTKKQKSISRELEISFEAADAEVSSQMSTKQVNNTPRTRKTPKSRVAEKRTSLEVNAQKSASKSSKTPKTPSRSPVKSTAQIAAFQEQGRRQQSSSILFSSSNGKGSPSVTESFRKTRDLSASRLSRPITGLIGKKYIYPEVALTRVISEDSSQVKSSTPYTYSDLGRNLGYGGFRSDTLRSSERAFSSGRIETASSNLDMSPVELFSPLSRAGISSSLRRTVLRNVPVLSEADDAGKEYSLSAQAVNSAGIESRSEMSGSKHSTLREIDTSVGRKGRRMSEEEEIDYVIGAMFNRPSASLRGSTVASVSQSSVGNTLYSEPQAKESLDAQSYTLSQSRTALSKSYRDDVVSEAVDSGDGGNEENQDDEEEEEEEEEEDQQYNVSYETKTQSFQQSGRSDEEDEEEDEGDEEEYDYDSYDADATFAHSTHSQKCAIL